MIEEQVTEERVNPLEHRVLVRRALRPEKTVGGIILPEQSRTISQTGIVVRVAKGVESVREGDTIIFSMYAASPCLATQDTDLVLVRDKDILARVEDG